MEQELATLLAAAVTAFAGGAWLAWRGGAARAEARRRYAEAERLRAEAAAILAAVRECASLIERGAIDEAAAVIERAGRERAPVVAGSGAHASRNVERPPATLH